MSTNKTSLGAVNLEVALCLLENSFYISTHKYLALSYY